MITKNEFIQFSDRKHIAGKKSAQIESCFLCMFEIKRISLNFTRGNSVTTAQSM